MRELRRERLWDRCPPASPLKAHVEDTVAGDDAFDASHLGPADDRQDAVALRQALEHDINGMIGMGVHERIGATTCSRAVGGLAPIVAQLVELLVA